MPIRILADEVASQIAAGEVVDRPASVVKELLENSLDAGATQVKIELNHAGRSLIEVADNGVGIPADELALAVTRHATSKLVSAEDLFRIATLGFRGEALASIGSVSRMSITTCQPGAAQGARLSVEGGSVGQVIPVGAPQGTVVRVEDLFFNVPARLKFLKADHTERKRIDDYVTRYAVAYPQVRFQLVHDGKTVVHTSGNGNQRETLHVLFGSDVARQMLEVNTEDTDFRLTGFISPTTLTRSHKNDLTFFVNRRWVRDAALVKALTEAYHTLLMVGRFPMAILFLEIPPGEVDVNVHPAKAEVRFRDPGRIYRDVQRAIRRGLLAYTPVAGLQLQPGRELDRAWQIDQAVSSGEFIQPSWRMAQDARASEQVLSSPPAASQGAFLPNALPVSGDVPASKVPPAERVPILRLVGQIASAYLVAEGPDGLYLVDQHAAHERVLFEKMMAQLSHATPAQALLEPVLVEFSSAQAHLLEGQLDILASVGFQVEPFGRNTFQVRAIPQLLSRLDPVSALRVLVEDFEEDETPLRQEAEARLIARVCKRAAVKAGQVLSVNEQQTLLRDLENCLSPRTCPHGRPTMIHLSVDLLERQFGRRGPR